MAKRNRVVKNNTRPLNFTLLILLAFPVVAIISLNLFFHHSIHKQVAAFAESKKEKYTFKKLRSGFNESEGLLEIQADKEKDTGFKVMTNLKLQMISKSYWNPLENEIQFILSSADDQIKFRLKSKLLDFKTIEFNLIFEDIIKEDAGHRNEIKNPLITFQTPLKTLGQIKDLKHIVHHRFILHADGYKLTDLKKNKVISSIGEINLMLKLMPLSTGIYKFVVESNFKNGIIDNETTLKNFQINSSALKLSLGNINLNKLIQDQSSPKDTKNQVMGTNSFTESFQGILIEASLDQDDLKLDFNAELNKELDLISIMNDIKYSLKATLPLGLTRPMIHRFLRQEISDAFFDSTEEKNQDGIITIQADPNMKEWKKMGARMQHGDMVSEIINKLITDPLLDEAVQIFKNRENLFKKTDKSYEISLNYENGEYSLDGNPEKFKEASLLKKQILEGLTINSKKEILDHIINELQKQGISYQHISTATPFITSWVTNTNGETITLPLKEGGKYNFIVDWGDGKVETISSWSDPKKTHLFEERGIHQIKMLGEISHFAFKNTGDKSKILNIEQWGNNLWASDGLEGAFHGCQNLNISAKDSPHLSEQTSLARMLEGATSLSANFEHWDTSKVKNMDRMFYGAKVLNQNLSKWQVNPNVTQCRDFKTKVIAEKFPTPSLKHCGSNQ